MLHDNSRRSLATPGPRVAGADATAVIGASARNIHFSQRMVLDLLGLLDVLLVVASATLAKIIYITLILETDQEHQPYVVAGLAGGILLHYIARTRGLHEAPAIQSWSKGISDLLITTGLAFLVVIAIAFLLKISTAYSRVWLLTWLALTILLQLATRPFYARLLSWLSASGFIKRRLAVVGTGAAREELAQTLSKLPGVGLAGVFSDAPTDVEANGGISDLIHMGQRNEIDEVVIALSGVSQSDIVRLVDNLSVLPVDVWLCPAEVRLPIHDTIRVGTLSLLQVKLKPICEWGSLLKLAFDYVVGAISLLVFAPLMLLIALAIKLDSPGPVFFRQRRHGFNHLVIYVYKFRTMYVAQDGPVIEQAQKDDPRVTRLGRLLRKTSLDELPQLINVMRGEMSLVGPRPHALAHNHYYCERLDSYASRHRVKPGLTGWAQIHGLRGPTNDPEEMRRRVQMDLYYVENWSLWLDLKILAATPFLGFINRNAL